MIAPYVPSLTAKVAAYLNGHGVDVVDAISLGVADNVAVGRLDPARLSTSPIPSTWREPTPWSSRPASRCRRCPPCRWWSSGSAWRRTSQTPARCWPARRSQPGKAHDLVGLLGS
jgi:hypothetical protein